MLKCFIDGSFSFKNMGNILVKMKHIDQFLFTSGNGDRVVALEIGSLFSALPFLLSLLSFHGP